jgi:outer membrane protein
MKIMLKSFIILFAIAMAPVICKAQEVKLGYVRMDALVSNMPEYQQAQTDLKAYKGELSSTLETKYQDYQTKLAEFEKSKDKLDEVILKDKESELKHLQSSLQEFDDNANESFEKKERSIFEPIEQKLKETIEQIANAKGYTHISQKSTFIFIKDESADITDLVAEKLGYTIEEEQSEE